MGLYALGFGQLASHGEAAPLAPEDAQFGYHQCLGVVVAEGREKAGWITKPCAAPALRTPTPSSNPAKAAPATLVLNTSNNPLVRIRVPLQCYMSRPMGQMVAFIGDNPHVI